jgi:hypothetical protein
MKTILVASALVLTLPLAAQSQQVPTGDWNVVYGELVQCVTSMGFCLDVSQATLVFGNYSHASV